MSLQSRDAELTSLTGLRGFAALWVLVYHVWVEATPRLITLGPLDLTPLFSAGWAGVDIFFTLSAFLLSLPYASRQLEGAPRPSLRGYWLRRVQRILPAYYGQLAVLIALAAVAGIGSVPTLGQLLGNLLLLNNLGPFGAAPINPVSYTLAIEFSFYVILPLLAYWLRPGRWWWLALLAIAVTQAWRQLIFPLVAEAAVPLRVVALEQMPGRLDQFAAGMLAAYAYTRAVASGRRANTCLNDALLLAGMALFAALLWSSHYTVATYWEGHWLLFTWHGLAGIATALMLYAGARGSRIARALFDNAALRWLGLVSFGLYLWHFPLLQWLTAAHVFDSIDGYRLPWMLPVVLLLASLIAALSYRWIELPILRLGRPRSAHPQLRTEMIASPATARPTTGD
ncbi:MAG: acyltransferase [Dokdonella sp.]|nr:MAG: acyltransferase [Dokdonella sp.]